MKKKKFRSIRDGKFFKRYDAKKGKTPPPDFEPAEDSPDPVTGHWPGWLPVGDGPEDRWHREALEFSAPFKFEHEVRTFQDGTFELCGPKVQGNPEKFSQHVLVPHGGWILADCQERTFAGIRAYLAGQDIEGIVWHHPDGRMAKIKKKDFGLPRKPVTP